MLNLWKIRQRWNPYKTSTAIAWIFVYFSILKKMGYKTSIWWAIIKTLYYRNFNIYVGQGLNDLDDSWDVKGVRATHEVDWA